MINLVKIDFKPVLDYVITLPNADELLDRFEFLEICNNYNFEDPSEDFFEWFEKCFNNDYLDEIENFISIYPLPLGLSLFLALYKSICKNSDTLESFLDNGDSVSDLITEGGYSITKLGIEDIDIDRSFKINHSTFLLKKIESDDLNNYEKFNQLYVFIEENMPILVKQIQLLSVLTDFEDILQLSDYLFIYQTPNIEFSHEDLVSKLKLYSVVVNGKILHRPINVNEITFPNIEISFENNSVQYRQFDDIAVLLSQFNSEERLLSKFLILYQILENFEIKHDVVKEMRRSGQFKVRQFINFANEAQFKELPYLKKLLSELFKLNYNEFTTNGNFVTRHILDIVRDSWSSISRIVDLNQLEHQLKQIGYDKANISNFSTAVANSNSSNFTNLTRNSPENNLISFLTESIYKLRCSIVHYKTHEFHLNDVNLDNMAQLEIFLTDFLVPLLHKIISISIFSANSPIVYPQNHLTLF